MSSASSESSAVVPPPTSIRYRVLAWMCSIAAIAYLQRNAISVLKEPLAAELALDAGAVGVLTGVFYAGYAMFQIPGGLLRDYWGTRTTMTVVTLVGAIALGLLSVASDVWLLCLAWLSVGACQAALFPCAVSAIRYWFPPTGRATASGWLAACMSLGGALSTSLAGWLLGSLSWRGVWSWFALPAVVWAVLFALLYRSRPEWHPKVNAGELSLIQGDSAGTSRGSTVDTVHGPTPWRAIFGSVSLALLFLQQCFRAAGQVFYGTWFPTYLQQARGVALEQSGYLTSLPQLALMCGALVGGLVSDRLLRQTGSPRWAYQGVAIVSLSLCAALILVSYAVADATWAVVVIAVGQFFGALAGPAAYAVSIAKGGRHLSTVFSTMNMAGNLGAMALPWILPTLVAHSSWHMVPALFAGLFALAGCCWLWIQPSGAIDDD